MKSIIILIILGSFNAFALIETTVTDEGLEVTAIDTSSSDSAQCGNNAPSVGGDSKGGFDFCNEKIFKDANGKPISKKEYQRRVKKLRKLCKKKARKYKKAVMWDMFKKVKLYKFVQAALKSKKKIIKRSGVTKSDLSIDNINLSAKEMENLSKDDFSKLVLDKLKKEHPELIKQMKQVKSGEAMQEYFSASESFPITLMVDQGDDNACLIDMNTPQETEYKPKACEVCEIPELQSSFVSDCSYMVGEDVRGKRFSEVDARKLMGKGKLRNQKGKDPLCNAKGTLKNSTGEINKVVSKLCDIAREGLSPDFTIMTSRNMIPDKTPELAVKRGEFIQKYMFDQLKHCKVDDKPDWMNDFASFEARVKRNTPEYLREGNTPGNYGPAYKASGAQIEKEVDMLEKTLNKEYDELNKNKRDYQKEYKANADRISEINEEINKQKDHMKFLQEEQIKEFDAAKDLVRDLNQGAGILMNLYGEKKNLIQKNSDISYRIKGIDESLASRKYEKNANGRFAYVNRMNDYYSGKNKDRTVFEPFKMVRINGAVEKEDFPGIPNDMINSELKMALNILSKSDQFTCVMDPIKTKRFGLSLPAKIGRTITLPVVGLAAGIGSLFCKDRVTRRGKRITCSKPGRHMPGIGIKRTFAKGSLADRYIRWGLKGMDDRSERGPDTHHFGHYSRKKKWRRKRKNKKRNVDWGTNCVDQGRTGEGYTPSDGEGSKPSSATKE